MKGRAATAGRRLSLGTWLQLEAWGRWLSGKSHADRSGLVRLAVSLRRAVACALTAVFYGQLLERVPGGIYVLPLAWVIGAWQMSDTSATPPPQQERPSCRKCAGRTLVSVTPSGGQKGMLIYTSSPPDRPNHTHVHVQQLAEEAHA
uniref:hypothetical protein n=1 Tax=Streptomyces asoensis TaxID=249586 RepID=UPI001C0F23B1|nr:hypothetical protein [Streptomyces asoensis]